MTTSDTNTGGQNAGNWNAGDLNAGHRNTGDWNAGNRNAGDWNTGNWNTGFFCTGTPSPSFFDLPSSLTWDEAASAIPYVELPMLVEFIEASNMTEDEKVENPNHVAIGGFLRVRADWSTQKVFPVAWAKLDQPTRGRFTSLPNFDAEKFLKCTGVDVRSSSPGTVRIKLATGQVVELVGRVV